MAALLGAASSAETQTGSTARLCCHQGANDTPAIRMLAQVPEEQEGANGTPAKIRMLAQGGTKGVYLTQTRWHESRLSKHHSSARADVSMLGQAYSFWHILHGWPRKFAQISNKQGSLGWIPRVKAVAINDTA
eukprot:1146321-Pelagomonas_calceolata.AAC.6